MKKIEKEFAITVSDTTMQLISYLEVAQGYVDSHLYVPEMFHVGRIIEQMKKVLNKQAMMIEPAKFLIKRNEESSNIYIKSPLEKIREQRYNNFGNDEKLEQ